MIFEKNEICAGGFTEFCVSRRGLTVKYGIKFFAFGGEICKLFVSSGKFSCEPVLADTLEIKEQSDGLFFASGAREIALSEFEKSGFSPSFADTFVVIKKDEYGAKKVITTATETAAEEPLSPKERGKKALLAVKAASAGKTRGANAVWARKISDFAKNLNEAKENILPFYTWYELRDVRAPLSLSAYRHVMYCAEVLTCFEKTGYLLLGVNGFHTALAAKADFNPFVNAEDCAEKAGDWFAVGVLLGEDGVYFEKAVV